MRRWLLAIALGLGLVLAIAPRGRADTESRFASLQSELFSQRIRIDRLESQLAGANRANPSPSIPANSPGIPRVVSAKDPMFERLATLAVELKEDVRDLQAELKELRQRLAQVEKRQH